MRGIGRFRDNKNLLIVIGLCVIIFGAVILSQEGFLILKDDLNYDSSSLSSVTYGVYGYDDGELIPIPVENVFLSPFRIGEVEYSEIAVKVEWTSTGEAIDWSTFTLTGSMEVKYLKEIWQDQAGGGGHWIPQWVSLEITSMPASSVASASWIKTFVLGTDLCSVAHVLDRETGIHAGETGWGYSFSGSVYGSVYDDFGGGPLTDTASFGGLSIWITYVADYSLTADITYT